MTRLPIFLKASPRRFRRSGRDISTLVTGMLGGDAFRNHGKMRNWYVLTVNGEFFMVDIGKIYPNFECVGFDIIHLYRPKRVSQAT